MLGWGINVWRQTDQRGTPAHLRRGFIAAWEAGLGGLEWLDALVAAGRAEDLGGSGYPNTYTLTAGVLAEVLSAGVPSHTGPDVIGDDYVLPGGWTGPLHLERATFAECSPDEVLVLEAWDLS
ncbi:MAG: hypothetical protein FJ304_10940 [Planctomycetes bacterium]|nr:hypothetical protein [Planctomycetota bacterium]